jgi:hypothetical protein
MQELRTDESASITGTLTEPAATTSSCNRTAGDSDPQIAHLAQSIQHGVHEQTFGGVRDLEVRINAQGIVLRGRCSSFYCKQLAQHAAIRLAGQRRLVNEIEVW